jgi:CubicO group peptidase (beta-lactamase class C family)
VHVPSELKSIMTVGEEVDSGPLGLDSDTIAGIWKAVCDLYRSGVHPGLQLRLRRQGEVVLNRAIGHARGNGPDDDADEPKVLLRPETPFCVFSTSKAVTAMVVHLLQEQGALDIADRVTDYIPEYGVHGKQDTTIGHVLSHRAGLPGLPREALDLDRVGDREF